MEVNLKKAHDLEQAAQKAAQAIKIAGYLSISVYAEDSLEAEISTARINAVEQLEQINGLLMAAYAIRALKQQANAASGIDVLMTSKASTDKRLKVLGDLISSFDASGSGIASRLARATGRGLSKPADDVVKITKERMAATRRRLENPDGAGFVEDNLTVVYIEPRYVEQLKEEQAKLTRERTAIQDVITAQNWSHRIMLSPETVAVLRENKIID